ncbi:MAG: hypothetical protein P4M09_00015, partial [Devosia sp.]|nr:hypothetical protein [Devosia sp.]
MTKFDYSISTNWTSDRQTAFEIGQNGVKTLDLLNPIGPPFSNWSIVDVSETYIPMEQAREHVTRLVEENASRDDYGEPWPEDGYSFWASTLSPPAVPFARSASLTVRAGSPNQNHVTLKVGGFGAPPELDLITYAGFKAALVVLASIWPCRWFSACAFSNNYWR